MKFGIRIPPPQMGPIGDPEFIIRYSQLVESLGFESIWTIDHAVMHAALQARVHGLVLGPHQLAHPLFQLLLFEIEFVGIVEFLGSQDVATVKEMGDDVRIGNTTVLGLDVEQETAIAEVVVESADHPEIHPPEALERRDAKRRHAKSAHPRISNPRTRARPAGRTVADLLLIGRPRSRLKRERSGPERSRGDDGLCGRRPIEGHQTNAVLPVRPDPRAGAAPYSLASPCKPRVFGFEGGAAQPAWTLRPRSREER